MNFRTFNTAAAAAFFLLPFGACAQETWWGDNFAHPCDPGLGLSASCVTALANPAPGGVGYIVGSGQLGLINLTRFSTTGSYIDVLHFGTNGSFDPASIQEMSNGDYLVACRYAPSGGSQFLGVLVARINPVTLSVVNHIVIGSDTSARVLAREMSDGSVTVLLRRGCSNAPPGNFSMLANVTLPASGVSPTFPWIEGYQGTPGDDLNINDFVEKPGTGGGPNTIVFVGAVVPPFSIGAIACIGEVNATTGAAIGSLHSYSTGQVGGGSFDRVALAANGDVYAAGSETVISFPNSITSLRVARFTNPGTVVFDRLVTVGLVPTGIALRGSPAALFISGSNPQNNTGFLSLFSPANGSFAGCQTFNITGTEYFTDMVLDYSAPSRLPVMVGVYDATLNASGTNFGYFVRTSANGTTPCSLPVFPTDGAATTVHGVAPITRPPVVGGINQPIPCNSLVYSTLLPFQAQGSACVVIGGGTGPGPWHHKICGPCAQQCGIADMGAQGGVSEFCGDGVLDNNDFVVFINEFFDAAARADIGSQGGEAGADGQFDNNDFVIFIDRFFVGC